HRSYAQFSRQFGRDGRDRGPGTRRDSLGRWPLSPTPLFPIFPRPSRPILKEFQVKLTNLWSNGIGKPDQLVGSTRPAPQVLLLRFGSHPVREGSRSRRWSRPRHHRDLANPRWGGHRALLAELGQADDSSTPIPR